MGAVNNFVTEFAGRPAALLSTLVQARFPLLRVRAMGRFVEGLLRRGSPPRRSPYRPTTRASSIRRLLVPVLAKIDLSVSWTACSERNIATAMRRVSEPTTSRASGPIPAGPARTPWSGAAVVRGD